MSRCEDTVMHNRNHPRNAAFRFRTTVYVFDFAVEMAMIVSFALWPHTYSISISGKVPDWGITFAKLAMQIISQWASNTVQIIFVTLRHGVDSIVFAGTRCQYWAIMAGVF